MDIFTKKQRSLVMAKVKSSGTDIELLLCEIVKPLWKIERYRKNVKSLPGKPDLVFPKSKIVIFVDGDFWHGRDFKKWKKKVPTFWKNKIESNIARDKKQNEALRKMGYRVLRFWGSSMKKKTGSVSKRINKLVSGFK